MADRDRLRRRTRRLRRGRGPRRVRRRAAHRPRRASARSSRRWPPATPTAGVVPIENVINGTVRENYDLLMEFPLTIHGEVAVPVALCLAALPGQPVEAIERVYSHIQALGQAEAFLRLEAVAAPDDLQHRRRGQGDRRSRGARRCAPCSRRAPPRCSASRSWPTGSGTCRTTGRASSCSRRPRRPCRSRPAPGTVRRTTIVVAVRNEPGTLLAVLRVIAAARAEHAQARVAAQPRASLGVRLLDRPRRRRGRSGDGHRPRTRSAA